MRRPPAPLARAAFQEALAREALHARALLGGRDYRRFVVVSVARTGSTLLNNLLTAQGNVLAFGELFRGDGAIGWDLRPFNSRQGARLQQLHETRPLQFLEKEVFRAWPREIAAVGFKLFYYHARSGPQAQVWDYLQADPSIAVIHLKRRNILEQYASLRVAHETNVWSSTTAGGPAPEPIRLDPEACRRHFEEVRAQESACDALFGVRARTVAYEDLIADRTAAMGAVAAHIGVELKPAKAALVRQRTEPLTTAIANYAELRDHFAGSPWESFFHAPDTALAQREAS
jgi:LPS sulfotransferase NodH